MPLVLWPDDVVEADVALRDAESGRVVTYGDLMAPKLARLAGPGAGRLMVAFVANDLESLIAYVAGAAEGWSVALLDRGTSLERAREWVDRYEPDLVAGARASAVNQDEYRLLDRVAQLPSMWLRRTPGAECNPDLAVLLATSGSTGNPKLVRLADVAVRSNAATIASSLPLRGSDVAPTCLPFQYSYGLSIVNSNLFAGAELLVTGRSVTEQAFWDQVTGFRATSLAGVPFTYQMLRRIRFQPGRYPSLRYSTQAGGRLSDDDRRHFLQLFSDAGQQFYVMYGQTEATARMAIAPPELLDGRISVSGRAIPGGAFEIADASSDGVGRIIYRGPNVMMGYANSACDLTAGDVLGGVLDTGDLGRLADGVVEVTGRLKRIAKVFGVRVDLDDVESWLGAPGTAAVSAGNECLHVHIAIDHHGGPAAVQGQVTERLGLHRSGVRVHVLPALPRNAHGKIDYMRLTSQGER